MDRAEDEKVNRLSPRAAGRLASCCPLILIGLLYLLLTAAGEGSEGMDGLWLFILAFFFGLPVALWLVIVAARLADRRPRMIEPARTTGTWFAAAAGVLLVFTLEHPGVGTLAAAGMIATALGMRRLLARPDLALMFAQEQLVARTGTLPVIVQLRRGVMAAVVMVAGALIVYIVGGFIYLTLTSGAAAAPLARAIGA